ncbi:MAG: MliC family protein [Asticcacaulis sp.]
MQLHRLILAGMALSLTACATLPSETVVPSSPPPPPPPPAGPISDVVYNCANGTRFTVYFHENAATVTLSDGTKLELPQQPVASGMHYATPRHDFRGKGTDATWTVGRMAPTECRAN